MERSRRSDVLKQTIIIIEAADRKRGERKKAKGGRGISDCIITVRYNTAQYCTVQHITIHYTTLQLHTCPFHRCSEKILAIWISVYRIGKT